MYVALLRICGMLTEHYYMQRVTNRVVQELVHPGTTFTSDEIAAIVDVANVMLPFWRGCCSDDDTANIPLQRAAPFWCLCDAIARAASEADGVVLTPSSSLSERAVGITAQVRPLWPGGGWLTHWIRYWWTLSYELVAALVTSCGVLPKPSARLYGPNCWIKVCRQCVPITASNLMIGASTGITAAVIVYKSICTQSCLHLGAPSHGAGAPRARGAFVCPTLCQRTAPRKTQGNIEHANVLTLVGSET